MRFTILVLALLWAGPADAETVDLTAASIVDADPVPMHAQAIGLQAFETADVATIRRWINSRAPAVDRCRGDDGPLKHAHPPVPLRVRIATDGRVEATARTGDAAAERCIAAAFDAHRFAPRPDAKPVVWTGLLDFGYAAASRFHGFRTISLPAHVVERDARFAAGRAPTLPRPERPQIWSPPPAWAERHAAIDWTWIDRAVWACPTRTTPGETVRQFRALVHHVDGQARRVELHHDLGPQFERCATTALRSARFDAEGAVIATRVFRRVTPLPREGPRVIPGKPTTCCDGGWATLMPLVRARRPAIEACYRGRLISRPDLRGEVAIRVTIEDRSTPWRFERRRGALETRTAVVADRSVDDVLAGCVAATLESITLPPGALVHRDPRVGISVVVVHTFEVRPPPSSEPAAPTPEAELVRWLMLGGVDITERALIERAAALPGDPHMIAGHAAVRAGRVELARSLFTAARDRSEAAGDIAAALDAHLARIELIPRGLGDFDGWIPGVLHAIELDAARDGSPTDALADRVEGAIAQAAFAAHRVASAPGPDASAAARQAARMYRLWHDRSDSGARRRPATEVYMGDARMLEHAAHFATDRGDERRSIALFGRWLELFPDAPNRAAIIDARLREIRFLAKSGHRCRLEGAPKDDDTPDRPCPAWLNALATEYDPP